MTNNQPNNLNTPDQIDINKRIPPYYLNIAETEYIVKSRKSQLEEINKFTREILVTIAAVAGIGFMIYFCFGTIQSKTSSADDKKWAQSTLTFIIGGGIGYLSGKNQKES